MASLGVAEPFLWPLGVVWPLSKIKIMMTETTSKSLRATPVWLGGGFGHLRPASPEWLSPWKCVFVFFF
jgi:hypothetical protein